MYSVREHLKERAANLPTSTGCCIAFLAHRRMSQISDDLRKQAIVAMGSGPIRSRSLIVHGAQFHAFEKIYVQG